ncbi:nitric-oxide reductase large subunit [Halobacterium sp. KA-6]|uniref:nitric-oxide reductase large subunit n=1 Tax=Halobacterium sp. KA-6 TaxID=2896368 RepID=UPI001E4FB66E|nr:cbb3-type cytochrome c oxidase subunit I [Halobacterium sp. KA-6]MCD2203715.1 cbb3-type cytochrome c oxidase subunit I [Halobacterium sp. KA-6]
MKVRKETLAKALLAIFVFNLVFMGTGAYFAYQQSPERPDQIVGAQGDTLATNEDIVQGKAAFQQNGLMNLGSILGNGAYFGADYTADAQERLVTNMRRYVARERYGTAYAELTQSKQAAVNSTVKRQLQNGEFGKAVQLTGAETYAYKQVRQSYIERYYGGAPEHGIPAEFVQSKTDAKRFADFALWTALFSSIDRPNSDISWTNEWPYNPGAGNSPPVSSLVWSVVSMVLLVGGGGLGIWLYKSVELPEPEIDGVDVPHPKEIELFPSQFAAVRFVPVAAVLFVVQTLLGGLMAHYYIERQGFYGIAKALGFDAVQMFPFSIAKAWHIDLAILWIATLWLGIGLFLPPLLTGTEPDNQKSYVHVLLGALFVVVVGGLLGIWLGAQGYIDGALWWILGNEGLEYLEVGRLWQIGLLAGFGLWTALVARGFKPMLREESRYGLAHLILYAGGSIGLLFSASMLYTPKTSMVVTEFWRWWVVHMWVEGAFEFFIVVIISVTLVSMNLLKRRSAEKAVIFEALFVMGAGVIGVSHHYWWIGLPEYWVPIGTVFSTLEFIPLVFILYEALNEYRVMSTADESFPYTLPFMFIIASGVWNFVGAGVLGFFINLPLVNYYEHGTFLTVGHAHAAMFGAFGFLALGMATYILRFTTKPGQWTETNLRRSFWLLNIGLAWMVIIGDIPIGFLQLETVFTQGYDAARSLAFYNQSIVQNLFWARLPGDILIILGSGIFCYDVLKKRFVRREETDTSSDGTIISRRIFGEDEDQGVDLNDD